MDSVGHALDEAPLKRTPSRPIRPNIDPNRRRRDDDERVLNLDPYIAADQANVIDIRKFLLKYAKVLEQWYNRKRDEITVIR